MEGHSSSLVLGTAGSCTQCVKAVCALPKPEAMTNVQQIASPSLLGIGTTQYRHPLSMPGHRYQRPLPGSHSLGLAAPTLGTWPWLRLWHHPTGATGQPWPLAGGAALRKRLFICTV